MIISEENYLAHYGILRRSGRYPWGSGGPEYASNKGFLDYVAQLKKSGMSDTEVAKAMGINTAQLRASKTIAKNEERAANIAQAQRLKEKGYSNVAIGQQMGIPESSVRNLLADSAQRKVDVLQSTVSMLRDEVAKKEYIDVGKGVENQLGLSKEKLAAAVAVLKEEGYKVHHLQVEQVSTGKMTSVKVLSKPDVPWKTVNEAAKNGDIHQIQEHTEDGGKTYIGIRRPTSIDSKRVAVRYAEEGGTDADGVIYVRRGVDDISLGGSNYAQVRIMVDGTHYLKGMAVYKDDLPDGVDLLFNTNKSNTGNKLDAMKKVTEDPDNPFGSSISRQHGVLNIVNEEGKWSTWSKSLSTQFLSKQSPTLAKQQLDKTYEKRQKDLEEILALTNPAVRKKLLQSFSDDADAASVHLKAAALPRMEGHHVLLPVSSMKENEVYAPKYQNGERVVLIRHPHGGTFEIPELTVNNRNPEARALLGKNPKDAIGINPKVAERLSGADFDGDTVLVIPNNEGRVKSTPALEGLKGFDPKAAYPAYDGMKRMTSHSTQVNMGDISNLITDMTIKRANTTELAAAVRHSMVVIDAEKHNLNYKQSYQDNGIANLKKKYQGSARGGASTLISNAGKTSTDKVLERKLRPASEGGPIDKQTGALVYVPTGKSWTGRNGETIYKKEDVPRLALVDDAHAYSSGTPIEKVYADHSNRLKALANKARLEMVQTQTIPYSKTARQVFSKQVKSLDAKLNIALQNAPRERQAQLIANAKISAKRQSNPNMDADELKKVKSQELAKARVITGANKSRVTIEPDEWDAIQAGAVSNAKLERILANTDIDVVRQLATPREARVMTPATSSRAKQMLDGGFTYAEISRALGIPVSTLTSSIGGE